MTGIVVLPSDVPRVGGMIARTGLAEGVQWYLSPEEFQRYYEPPARVPVGKPRPKGPHLTGGARKTR